jgi:hypothetical protein
VNIGIPDWSRGCLKQNPRSHVQRKSKTLNIGQRHIPTRTLVTGHDGRERSAMSRDPRVSSKRG